LAASWNPDALAFLCPSSTAFQQHKDGFLYLPAKGAYLVIREATNALQVQLLHNVPVCQMADKTKALMV
jgi:hypothetical protein